MGRHGGAQPIRSTESSPVLVCKEREAGISLLSFSAVIYMLKADQCTVRINRFDPTPLEVEVRLQEEVFLNLFGIRR